MMGMAERGSSRKIANNLVSASGAAVLAVYLAGYTRTESAAERFASQVAERRVAKFSARRVRSVREGLSASQSSAPSPNSPARVPISELPRLDALTPPDPEGTAPAAVPTQTWKDGTYTGWGFSRHGNIEATVRIAGGRILSAIISQCRTRYSCGVIDNLPPQVARRQSPDVDYVSGATQSADAFYEAVVAALNKAK